MRWTNQPRCPQRSHRYSLSKKWGESTKGHHWHVGQILQGSVAIAESTPWRTTNPTRATCHTTLGLHYTPIQACALYLRKWIGVEPIAQQIQKFLWKNIVCQHSLPHSIVTNNDWQFIDKGLNHFFGNLVSNIEFHQWSSLEPMGKPKQQTKSY